MIITVHLPVELDIRYVEINIPLICLDDEEKEGFKFFPFLNDERLKFTVEISTGQIQNWDEFNTSGCWFGGEMFIKVVDTGSYYLLDRFKVPVTFDTNGEFGSIEEYYVPNRLIPGEYGDYIDLKIDEKGMITNWYKNPSLSDFSGDIIQS